MTPLLIIGLVSAIVGITVAPGLVFKLSLGVFAIWCIGEWVETNRKLKEERYQNDLDAMWIAYRLGIRHLYRIHPDAIIRDALLKLADDSYGGSGLLEINLNDATYEAHLNTTGKPKLQIALKNILSRGYPLSIESGKVINRWNDNAVLFQIPPKKYESAIGVLEVRKVIRINKVGSVALCIVLSGRIQLSASVRVLREGETIHTDEVASLRHFENDVLEVKEGFECGVKLKNYKDIRANDRLEVFVVQEVPWAQ